MAQAVELGTIQYCNLEDDHGAVEPALALAKAQNKPILAVFAEVPG